MLQFSTWKQVAVILTCLLGPAARRAQLLLQGDAGAAGRAGCPRRSSPSASTCAAARICCCRWKRRTCARTGSNTLRDDARKRLRDAKIAFTGLGIANNAVQVRLAKAEDADAALKTLRGLIQQTGNLILGTTVTDLEVTKAEGGRDPHRADRGRPAAPHLQRHQRRHRDGAPARRCHGHHRADYRSPGQLAHPRAGAGPAGHGPAQGADRQDGALELPRGAPR